MTELHRHLEGSIRPETVFDLRDRSTRLQSMSLQELRDSMVLSEQAKNLADYISRLGTRFMLEVVKTPEDLERFVFEAVQDAANDDLEQLELRFTPANWPDIKFREAVVASVKQAGKKYGINTGLIYSMRRKDIGEVNRKYIAEGIDLFESGEVIAVDIAGDEAKYPTNQYQDEFAPAIAAGVPVLAHAGEAAGPESVKAAVELLQARRIGHGVAAAEDSEVLKLLRDTNTCVEICLTSNYFTRTIESIEDHPLGRFIEYEIPIAISTDNPITCSTTVSTEFDLAQQLHPQLKNSAREYSLLH